MDVRCERCETEYELEDSSVNDAGTSVQCTTCGHRFVVTKGSAAAPQPQAALPTPVVGHHIAGPAHDGEPQVPAWTLSTDNGKVHRFRDLNTLQKWIVERKVSRSDRLSHAGGPWLALGDMDELAPFFSIVDQADRPRASVRTPPPVTSSAGPPRRASAPTPAPPPPVPAEARKPVSPDGPTVPNRRLPDAPPPEKPAPSSASPGASAERRTPIRTPGLGLQPVPPAQSLFAGGPSTESPAPAPSSPRKPSSSHEPVSSMARSSPSMPASAYDAPTVALPATAIAEASALNAGTRPAPGGPGLSLGAGGAGVPKRIGLGDSVRSVPSAGGRPLARTESVFSSGPFEDSALLAMPNHRRRNVIIAVVVLGLAGGGGAAAFLYQQRGAGRPAPAWLATPSPASTGSAEHAAADSPPAHAGAEVRNAPAPASTRATPPLAASGPATKPEAAPSAAPAAPTPAPGGKPAGGSRARANKGGDGEAAPRGAGSTVAYEKLVSEADRLLERGQTGRAEKLYTQALGAKPDGAAALTGIAYVLLDRQRHFKAIETFRRVLDNQPAYGPALFGIAESYRARGDMAQALTAYRQYLSVSPSGADAPAARRQIKELESAKAGSASAARKADDDDDDEDD